MSCSRIRLELCVFEGGSAAFSEELELFLGNPRAPARRNSAPPPVGVASVRAPLTIRTSQAKAVPVIPPKVQYSSVPVISLHFKYANMPIMQYAFWVTSQPSCFLETNIK